MYRFYFGTNQNISEKIRCYIIVFFAMLLFSPIVLWGKVEIYEIFPNTIDDTNLEYIELRNTGCSDADISGYILEDASKKQYIFPASSIISPKNTLRINRPTSKIILNNTDEILYLKQPNGTIEDQFSYVTSTKWVIIIDLSVVDEICNSEINTGNTDTIWSDSGLSNTGNIDTGTGTINTLSWEILINPGVTNSGILDTNTGINNSGAYSHTSETGSYQSSGSESNSVIGGISNSGSTNTGTVIIVGNTLSNTDTTESGSVQYSTWEDASTGNIFTGSTVIFPEIIPTLQHPSNAIFSSWFFDCTNQNPCRINVTFDPIFTGGYLSKNYICTLITETGSSIGCNPNTFYFSTGSSLGFRLTSKEYPNEFKEIFWNITYRTPKAIPEATLENSNNWSNTGSYETNTWSTQTWVTQVQFPEIIPTFQNYTNTSLSGNILTCTTAPCRLNFTIDPIFTGNLYTKDYTCEVFYGTGKYDCNPPQLYLIGTGSIDIYLINKTSQEKIWKTLEVIQNIQSIHWWTISSDNQSSQGIIDKNPPIIILEFDGKMKSYHEIIWENEINCYTFTCSINLSAERSYDPEKSSIRYLWYYWPNDIKTTRDPGERKYGIWTHEIWLRVIDINNNVSSVRYIIHVLGDREIKNEKTHKIQKNTREKSIQLQKKTKKVKTHKIVFFEPPEIILQKSQFSKIGNKYICYTNTRKCSLNITLSWTQKWIVYSWKYDNGEPLISKNPKSHAFSPWKYTIQIMAWFSDNTPLWTQDIDIQVIKIKKSKKIKIKKIQPKKDKKKVLVTPNMYHKSDADPTNNTKENFPFTSIAILIGIFPIVLLRRIILAKKEYKK